MSTKPKLIESTIKMKVSSLKGELKPFSVEVAGETLTGFFKPRSITFAWSRHLQSIGQSQEPDLEIVTRIVEAVASWDLEYEEGQPVPLTTDALLDVPTEVLLAVLQEVAKAANPGEAKAAPMAAPSFANFSNEQD